MGSEMCIRDRHTTSKVVEKNVNTPERQLRELKQVSNNGDVRVFRATLIDWAKSYWPGDPPVNPVEIGRRLEKESLENQLREIDASLYGAQPGEVSLPQIYATLKTAVDDRKNASTQSTADPLPTL